MNEVEEGAASTTGEDLGGASGESNPAVRPGRGTRRWACPCGDPPILLGTTDRSGIVHLKARDRYWHVVGLVTAVCPRCGCEHVLRD